MTGLEPATRYRLRVTLFSRPFRRRRVESAHAVTLVFDSDLVAFFRFFLSFTFFFEFLPFCLFAFLTFSSFRTEPQVRCASRTEVSRASEAVQVHSQRGSFDERCTLPFGVFASG